MRWMYVAVIAVLALVTLIFALQNFQSVTVALLRLQLSVPLALLVIIVYVLGMATGAASGRWCAGLGKDRGRAVRRPLRRACPFRRRGGPLRWPPDAQSARFRAIGSPVSGGDNGAAASCDIGGSRSHALVRRRGSATLSIAAGHDGGAICRGRSIRRTRSHRRSEDGRAARPVGDRGECDRCGGHHRRHARHQRQAGRLHGVVRDCRHPRL